MEASESAAPSSPDPRDRVRRWMQLRDLSQRDLAKLLECDPSYPAHFLRPDRSPGLAIAVKLEELTADWSEGAITAREWVQHPPTIASPPAAGESPL